MQKVNSHSVGNNTLPFNNPYDQDKFKVPNKDYFMSLTPILNTITTKRRHFIVAEKVVM